MVMLVSLDKSAELIAQLRSELANVNGRADRLSAEACTAAVRLQRAMGLMSLEIGASTDPEMVELSTRLERMALDVAANAGRVDDVASSFGYGATGARATLEMLLTSFSAALEDINGRLALAEATARTAQATAQMQAQQARARIHAPSSTSIRDEVWQSTEGKCIYCDHALARMPEDLGEHYREFHIDHIVARANGGPDHISNYVPACDACNISKGTKSFVEFVRFRQRKFAVIEGGAAKDGTTQ